MINKVKYYEGKPLFSIIEFNLLNYCNRNCAFCPTVIPYKKKEMSLELYAYILLQLQEINYSGVISFSGFSEPLYHTELYYLVDLKTRLIPKAHLTINTNGDRLTKEMVNVLLKKGVNDICISKYEDNNKLNKFEKMDNVYIKDRFSNNDFINNRAGSLYEIKEPLKNICYYPYYFLYIDYNGDVLFCCHNYKKQGVIGNVLKKKIIEIWTGKDINRVRGKRNINPCNVCDVKGDLAGSSHFSKFNK
jgi:radical SAM protein with 4Fe4S-binding SPASM domain